MNNSYLIIGIITLIIIVVSYYCDKNNINTSNISNIALSFISIFTAVFTAINNLKNKKINNESDKINNESDKINNESDETNTSKES